MLTTDQLSIVRSYCAALLGKRSADKGRYNPITSRRAEESLGIAEDVLLKTFLSEGETKKAYEASGWAYTLSVLCPIYINDEPEKLLHELKELNRKLDELENEPCSPPTKE